MLSSNLLTALLPFRYLCLPLSEGISKQIHFEGLLTRIFLGPYNVLVQFKAHATHRTDMAREKDSYPWMNGIEIDEPETEINRGDSRRIVELETGIREGGRERKHVAKGWSQQTIYLNPSTCEEERHSGLATDIRRATADSLRQS